MKLAEALLLRADIQKKLESLKERTTKNTVVQEGEMPSEDPNELMTQAVAISDQLKSIVLAINEANLKGVTEKKRSITAALAERESLIYKYQLTQTAATSAAKPPERYGVKEIRWVKAVDVQSLHKQADEFAKQIREINSEIQAANWTIDVDLAL
jgi:hypothetical protein